MNSEINEIKDKTLGEIFAQKRESLQIGIKQAAEFLCIKKSDIILLENNQIKELQSQHLYVLGLIRCYGKFLKINSEIIEKKIKNLPQYCNVKNQQYQLINIGEGSKIKPSRDIFMHSLIVAITLSLLFLLIHNLNLKNNLISSAQLISRIDNLNAKY
jgi:cytoskeletal protein RodZ